MIFPETLILPNGLLILAAIAGLVMTIWMRPRTARVLTTLGLSLVLGHTVWTLLDNLVLTPFALDDLMRWLSDLILLVGCVLLVLAATVRPKPAAPAASSGRTPPASPPHHYPPPAPNPPRGTPRPDA